MGEVYRDADTQLRRQVAIKLSPAPLTVDADRLARFLQARRNGGSAGASEYFGRLVSSVIPGFLE
jgi:hypothetical protein